MEKQTKIIVIGIISALIITVLGVILFAKGNLVINSNVPISTILVDGKERGLSQDKALPLPVGTHEITVNQDYYKETKVSVFMFPWFKRTIAFSLVPTAEGTQIINIAKAATSISATFSSDKNSDKYLSSVKKYVNSDTYDNLLFQITDSSASQSTTSPIDLPIVSLPIGNIYVIKDSSGTLATVKLTRTSDNLSLSNIQFAFEKTENSWIITNIIYNQ